MDTKQVTIPKKDYEQQVTIPKKDYEQLIFLLRNGLDAAKKLPHNYPLVGYHRDEFVPRAIKMIEKCEALDLAVNNQFKNIL